MHSGKPYSFKEVIYWTRKDIYFLLFVATIDTCCYIYLILNGWMDEKI